MKQRPTLLLVSQVLTQRLRRLVIPSCGTLPFCFHQSERQRWENSSLRFPVCCWARQRWRPREVRAVSTVLTTNNSYTSHSRSLILWNMFINSCLCKMSQISIQKLSKTQINIYIYIFFIYQFTISYEVLRTRRRLNATVSK